MQRGPINFIFKCCPLQLLTVSKVTANKRLKIVEIIRSPPNFSGNEQIKNGRWRHLGGLWLD